ncbi:MAG: DUF420 domain-containing protein [Planctomycetota bacterium]|nr:DUF420 domain-containing protein [Planctomycetota bacterium]
MDLSFLPAVNASLNATAGVLLVTGFVFVKRKNIPAHRACMMSAFAASSLFLVFYITHYVWRASATGTAHTKYHGPAPTFYYVMLLTHIVLAMLVPVLAIWLIRLGLARRDALHRRVAKVALPIWLYVSVTGVLIYFMLYHLNPPAGS